MAFVSHRRFASFSRAGQESNNWITPLAKEVKKGLQSFLKLIDIFVCLCGLNNIYFSQF